MQTKPVLYAEDEENDAFLLRRTFKQLDIINTLQIVTDGQQAIDFLSGTGEFAKRQMPGLLLLDLNMPRKSGFDVLVWVRKDLHFSTLPVIILTSSSHERDMHTAYTLGANAYLIKPSSPDKQLEMTRTLKDFWLIQNQGPPDCALFKS